MIYYIFASLTHTVFYFKQHVITNFLLFLLVKKTDLILSPPTAFVPEMYHYISLCIYIKSMQYATTSSPGVPEQTSVFLKSQLSFASQNNLYFVFFKLANLEVENLGSSTEYEKAPKKEGIKDNVQVVIYFLKEYSKDFLNA